MSVGEPAEVIGTAERASFDDFMATSSGRLFAAALRQCEHQQDEAEDLLLGVLVRARRRWARISRSADPEAQVRQMLADAAAGQPRPAASWEKTSQPQPETGRRKANRQRPETGWEKTSQLRPGAGRRKANRQRPGAGWRKANRQRPETGWEKTSQPRPEAGWEKTSHPRPEAGWEKTSQPRPEAGWQESESGFETKAAEEAAGSPPDSLMSAVRHRHRRYQRRLGAGCVLGVAVFVVAVSLAMSGPRKLVPMRAVVLPSPATRVMSCVQAWHTHEARILCARYAGPPVPVVITPPPQAVVGPPLCRPVPSGGAVATPSPGSGRWHLAMHLCQLMWQR